MDLANQVQILGKAVGISFCANALGKEMNLTILSLAIAKY